MDTTAPPLLNVQPDENAPLDLLVTRFKTLRRQELLHTEKAIFTTLKRQKSLYDTLLDIKRWLKGQSKWKHTRPEIEYLQTAVYDLLKIILIGERRRQGTLQIATVSSIPFNKDIKPELKRISTRVSAKYELQERINAMLEKIKADIYDRQNIQYIKRCIHSTLKRVDTCINLRYLLENIYSDIDPVLVHIKSKFDVGQEIDDIKIAIDRMLSLQDETKEQMRYFYNTVQATMENNNMEMNAEMEMWCFHKAIDKLLSKKRHCDLAIISERQAINFIFDTIGSMLERLSIGVDVQYEKRQIQHAIKTLLERLKFKADIVQVIRRSSKDVIERMRDQISIFDEKRKIQEICDTRIEIMFKRMLDNDPQRMTQQISNAFFEMLKHIQVVFGAQRNILFNFNDIYTRINRINAIIDERNRQIPGICNATDILLEKINKTIDAEKQTQHITDDIDTLHVGCDERNDLLDIRIVLNAMLDAYFTTEGHRTQIADVIRVNKEWGFVGILNTIQIMLNRDVVRTDEKQNQDLKNIQKVIQNMIEPLAHRRTELHDIQIALRMMLDRIVAKVNDRRRFRISRIESCGSMAENTAVLKYDATTGEKYTEADYLAVLDCSAQIVHRDNGCRGLCVEVNGLPFGTLDDIDTEAISKLKIASGERVVCDRLFWQELHMCIGFLCDCFTVQFDEKNAWCCVSYSSPVSCETNQQTHCNSCAVEMPTGILKVNGSISFGGPEDKHCSLAFIWTSKAKSLAGSDKLLKEDLKQISSLQVHVDFLPALEVSKATTDEGAREHDFFLVSKHCNVCDRKAHWRKSNCIAEIAYMVNVMSQKHRKCYKIIKYFLSIIIDTGDIAINWYHVKTVALNHSRECSDPTEGCAECVLKILTELIHAYKTKTLHSFHESGVNILGPYYQSSSYTDIYVRVLEQFINRLSSVTDTDSCDSLLQPLQDPYRYEY